VAGDRMTVEIQLIRKGCSPDACCRRPHDPDAVFSCRRHWMTPWGELKHGDPRGSVCPECGELQ
jgi:hypothetical protein